MSGAHDPPGGPEPPRPSHAHTPEDSDHDHGHAGHDDHDHGHADHGDPGHTDHDDHGHMDHDDHGHAHADHDHDHDHGRWAWLEHLLQPHSHDAADAVDAALTGSADGIRAVQISLVVLGITAALQLAVAIASSSVAVLADTIHNFADASTALPLWLAFSLGRRPPTARYTYGYGRAEDLAGVFVVGMILIFVRAIPAMMAR